MNQHSLARRSFLRTGALAVGVSAVATTRATAAVAPASARRAIPRGRLLVAGFTNRRLRNNRQDSDLPGSIVEISLPGLTVRAVGSLSSNLHDLSFGGLGPSGPLFAIGQDVPELIELFAADLSERVTLRFPGVRFKGHAMPYGDGVLVAAESLDRPQERGFLLLLDADGKEIDRFATGALGPHEPIVCGTDIVVSHYGSAPRTGPFLEGELYESIAPGISVLEGRTLTLKAFHRLPLLGAVSHVARLSDRTVVAMQMNAVRTGTSSDRDAVTLARADKDGAVLLTSEIGPFGGYQLPLPLYVVDLEEGLVRSIERPANEMRRGQSFCRDTASGAVLGTFAHSQTLCTFLPGEEPIFRSSLAAGVADPRGCAALDGSDLFAVAGNCDNIALIDARTGGLVELIATPLEQHSHMRWFAA